jgi:hypothetical protein
MRTLVGTLVETLVGTLVEILVETLAAVRFALGSFALVCFNCIVKCDKIKK